MARGGDYSRRKVSRSVLSHFHEKCNVSLLTSQLFLDYLSLTAVGKRANSPGAAAVICVVIFRRTSSANTSDISLFLIGNESARVLALVPPTVPALDLACCWTQSLSAVELSLVALKKCSVGP